MLSYNFTIKKVSTQNLTISFRKVIFTLGIYLYVKFLLDQVLTDENY